MSYDIPDDKRRTRVHAMLKNYRTRVQYSVFECQLEPTGLAELQSRLAKVIEPHEDHLRYYRLRKDCLAQPSYSVLGQRVGLEDEGSATHPQTGSYPLA